MKPGVAKRLAGFVGDGVDKATPFHVTLEC